MERDSRLNREITAVLLFVLAVLVGLSVVSYDPGDLSLNAPSGRVNTKNWGGIAGAHLADALLQGLGYSAYLLPIFIGALAYYLFRRDAPRPAALKIGGAVLFVWSSAVLLSLLIDRESEIARRAGGIVGGFSREILLSFFGRAGTYVIDLALFLLAVMLVSRDLLVAVLEQALKKLGAAGMLARAAWHALGRRLEEWREKKKTANTKKDHREFKPPPIVLKDEVKEEPAKPKKRPPPAQEKFDFARPTEGYVLPSPSLLDQAEGGQVKIDKETLEANSLILHKKLADFGVEGEVVAVRPGPVITMYEFKPAPGVMVRRIVTLADDLSMALRALSVRILAPIPGESVVGIEIPNPRREKVFLRQIIESKAFDGTESRLTLALGKEISGAPFVADLAKMPHLLVAGATGTGKSVSINAMVLSILFKATPEQVQFIMVDPKMLELTVYEGLPHLLVPVVTDPKKAAAALFWAMDEMDRRYRLMRDKGARNIDQYNHVLERAGSGLGGRAEPPKADQASLEAKGANGGESLVHEKLPRIVIVIDELADLMMTVGRDIEEYITRLAQKARAAGIHMILATQRPSVDVITGLIKANFSARISFQVTSRVDSRTILDSIGAERLLGDGDMLYLPPGTARLMRIHGAYVSEQEIRRVMEFITDQAEPRYRHEVFESKKEVDGEPDDDDYDEMYDLAVKLVTETQQASISMLQRRLRVGYNRAARMVEQMERDGVVGPADGAKPREVYARKIDQ